MLEPALGNRALGFLQNQIFQGGNAFPIGILSFVVDLFLYRPLQALRQAEYPNALEVSFTHEVVPEELEVCVVGNANHAASLLAFVGKVGRKAGTESGKTPVYRHRHAP